GALHHSQTLARLNSSSNALSLMIMLKFRLGLERLRWPQFFVHLLKSLLYKNVISFHLLEPVARIAFLGDPSRETNCLERAFPMGDKFFLGPHPSNPLSWCLCSCVMPLPPIVGIDVDNQAFPLVPLGEVREVLPGPFSVPLLPDRGGHAESPMPGHG